MSDKSKPAFPGNGYEGMFLRDGSIGITNAQYHACLDKLWAAFQKTSQELRVEENIFDGIARYVAELEDRVRELEADIDKIQATIRDIGDLED